MMRHSSLFGLADVTDTGGDGTRRRVNTRHSAAGTATTVPAAAPHGPGNPGQQPPPCGPGKKAATRASMNRRKYGSLSGPPHQAGQEGKGDGERKADGHGAPAPSDTFGLTTNPACLLVRTAAQLLGLTPAAASTLRPPPRSWPFADGIRHPAPAASRCPGCVAAQRVAAGQHHRLARQDLVQGTLLATGPSGQVTPQARSSCSTTSRLCGCSKKVRMGTTRGPRR